MKTDDEMRKTLKRSDFIAGAVERDGLMTVNFKEVTQWSIELLKETTSPDPTKVFLEVVKGLEPQWTGLTDLPPNGVWHHWIAPGAVIAALRNAGLANMKDEHIVEAVERGALLPGGTCGFLGVCGGYAATGIVIAIVGESTPLNDKERGSAIRAVGEASMSGWDPGGPRCCKRATFHGIETAIKILGEMGYELENTSMQGACEYFGLNEQCLEDDCPYYPS